MTEVERQIAVLLAQAQMDRESAPSNPSALASALTKYIPEDKPRFGRWQPEALASGETAKAGIMGKLLGALGLDASGNRAATSWGDAAKHTAGNVINAPQDIGNQLLDLQDYQPVYGTGASNPEDRARAGQQAVSTFGLAGLAPLGGVVAGRAARPTAGLQDGAGANPSAQLTQMLRGEGHTPGTVMLPKESFPVSEGNYSPVRGQWLEDPPGQDVAARRLDGSALYANSKEAAASGLLAQAGEKQQSAHAAPVRAYRGVNVGNEFGPHPDFGNPDIVWASSHPGVASEFAQSGPKSPNWSPAVYPLDMDFKNPMVVDAKRRVTHLDDLAEEAMTKGHDGLVVQRVRDTPDMRDNAPVSTVYAALKPNTIRSKITGETLYANSKEGALPGLAMDHASRMERARELGFDTETVYHHGTPHGGEISEFRIPQGGQEKGVWFTPNAEYAAEYSGRGGQSIQTHLRMQNPLDLTDEAVRRRWVAGNSGGGGMVERARALGHDSIVGLGLDGNEVLVFDPKNVRSPNAAFDPAQRDSPNLLASNSREGAAPGLLAQAGEQTRRPKIEQVWGPKWDILMGQQYRIAEAGGDLSSMYDILSAKLSKAGGLDPEMRAAMQQKVREIATEMGPEWRARAGIPDPDGNLLTANAREAAPLGLLGQAGEQKGITAYHGSPHDFDKFSLDKIGTGEGAQAYGHGLYFAENEGVAKSYRDALSPAPSAILDGSKVHQMSKAKAFGLKPGQGLDINQTALLNELGAKFADTPETSIARIIADEMDIVATQRARIESEPKNWLTDQSLSNLKLREDTLRLFQEKGLDFDRPGKMYEVKINAEPEQFLDWDKPLSQQSEAVRKAVKPLISKDRLATEGYTDPNIIRKLWKDPHGQMIYKNGPLAGKESAKTSQSELSAALRDAGIPGIRYLDQGSRTAGEGSRNFVVFDENLISIVKKYGWAGAAAMYGMSAEELQAQAPDEMQPVRNRLTKALTSD